MTRGDHAVAARLRHEDGAVEDDAGRLSGRLRRGAFDRGDTRSARAFPAETTGSSSMSPISRARGRLSTRGELHVDLDEADFLAVFPLAKAGRG